TLDTQNYNFSPSTVFGMWNTSDQVSSPPGGNPVYQLQLMDSNGFIVNPTTLTVYGKGDNLGQVAGAHEMDMNPADGVITPGVQINGGSGTHTSATFWTGIPIGTKQIIVYADLPSLNPIGDGVGYYFAEVVPEPTGLALFALGLYPLSRFGGRRRR
ncbi:MAG: PEP-CTERM sorting domain-containing protein, partial [Tepidisphaeraceae bacterium]